MRLALPLLAASLLAASCAPVPPPSAEPGGRGGDLAITHATVVDVTAASPGAALLPDHTVLVSGGQIAAVGPSAAVRVPRGARVVDARGKYLLPGLWDAHAHVYLAGESALPVYVANGVTTVRDLGGRLPALLEMRRRVAAGELAGPRLYVAGPMLEGAYWLDPVAEQIAGDTLLSRYPYFESLPAVRVTSAGEARAVMDSIRRLGVDMVKVHNLRGDEFRAFASEARRLGIPVVAHSPSRVPVGEVADSGVRSIEHMETVMRRITDTAVAARRAELARVARAGTAVTATLGMVAAFRQVPDSVAWAIVADTAARIDPRRRWVSRGLLDYWRFNLDMKKSDPPNDWVAWYRRIVADLHLAREAGVPILVGTDLGVQMVYPGFSVHDELRRLVVEGGLTPFQAIRGATVLPARTLGVEGRVGTVAPGMEADLLLLDADPLQEVGNTTRIRAVVLDGRLFDRAGLDALLAEGERMARATYR